MDEGFQDVLRQAQARVGRTLKDKWTLDRLVGVGGMAAVYAATHRNRKRAAVKMLHAELSLNASIRSRFLREGYVANSVEHPGAVAVDDDDVAEDGCAYLVMELLEGETLDARWERKGKRLPPDEVLSLMDQVLDTLAAAHAKGIVHRDLKPENLFLTRGGGVKILDFGIARVRELGAGASKTQTGSTMGTPAFMPPEQARGRWEEVDARSDLWAVGATMFTLLAGDYVHVAGTVNEALLQAMTAPARSVGTLRPDLPRAVIEVIDRALAFDRNARWPSATAMQIALRKAFAAIRDSGGVAEPADSAMRRARAELESSVSDLATAVPSASGSDRARGSAPKQEAAIAATLESAPFAPAAEGPPATEIPESPVRIAPAQLTTNRGVESTASGHRSSGSRKGVLIAAAAVPVVGAVVIGMWLGFRSPDAGSSETPAPAEPPRGNAAKTAGVPVEIRATQPGAGPEVAPQTVSLDQLPVAQNPPKQPAARPSAPPPIPSASARTASPARPPPDATADPFASRR